MTSPDTQMLMDRVKERTGYGVSIVGDSSISTHSGMTSASQSQPMHLIRINPKYEKYGDYLVALQCAMLLVKWADPDRIPEFAVRDEKADSLIATFSNEALKQGLSAAVANDYVRMIVSGILQQLNSMPIQLICMDMVTELCPGLEAVRREYVTNDLAELNSSFSKKIRKMTPKEIFDRNVAMNAAYAIKWSRISGSRSVLLPYRSMGFINKGTLLIDAYEENAGKADPDRHIDIVDRWAGILKMEGWYTWRFRKEERNE